MRSKLLILCSALLFLCAPAHAAPVVQEVKSASGVTAWLIEEHSLPLISLRAVFTDAGTATDPDALEGRANMAANLLTEGAGTRDALAFSTALEEHAIRLGISVDEDLLSASLETLSDQKDAGFALLADALNRPRFDAEAIARVRAETITTLRQNEQSPGWIAGRAWQKAAYGTHPYARSGDGTDKTIAVLAKKDFAAYRERYLTRANLVIGVVGDITPEQLKPLLDSTFGRLKADFHPEQPLTEVTLPNKGTLITLDKDIPQTMVHFGLQGLKRMDPAYFDGMVMNYILGGGDLNSKLAEEVREKRGLAYSINTWQSPSLHGAVWAGSFATRNEQAGEALRVARDTIATLASGNLTEDEVAKAKQFIAGSFVLSLDTNAELANFLISMQINKLGLHYLEERNAKVEAVTLASVKAVAKRLLDDARLIIVMIGKPEAVK